MAASDQYNLAEPELLRLFNEERYENHSLPSFSSMVARFSKGKLELQKSFSKTFSMDDTTSTFPDSTDESFASPESAKAVKVLNRQQYRDEECKVEYTIADFECKLYAQDTKNRLDEPVIEEIDHDSDDEFENHDQGEEDHDSVLSLNTLEKDEPDSWVTENCKLEPKMGCLGLLELGFSGYREEEAHLTASKNAPELSSIYDTEKLNTAYLTANDNALELSSIYDIEKLNNSAAGIFVVNEVCCESDDESDTSEITILRAEDESVLYDPFPYDDDDPDADDRDRLEQLVIVETESVSSDWVQGKREKDEDSHATS